jgi:hypothetical protein
MWQGKRQCWLSAFCQGKTHLWREHHTCSFSRIRGNTLRQFLLSSEKSQVPIIAPLLGYMTNTNLCLQALLLTIFYQRQDDLIFRNYLKFYILKTGKIWQSDWKTMIYCKVFWVENSLQQESMVYEVSRNSPCWISTDKTDNQLFLKSHDLCSSILGKKSRRMRWVVL